MFSLQGKRSPNSRRSRIFLWRKRGRKVLVHRVRVAWRPVSRVMMSTPPSQLSATLTATMTGGEGIKLLLYFSSSNICITICFHHMLYSIKHYQWYMTFKHHYLSFKDPRSTWETKPCHMIVSSFLIRPYQRLMRVWGRPRTAFMGKWNLYRYLTSCYDLFNYQLCRHVAIIAICSQILWTNI